MTVLKRPRGATASFQTLCQALRALLGDAGHCIPQHVWPQPPLTRDAFEYIRHHDFLAVLKG